MPSSRGRTGRGPRLLVGLLVVSLLGACQGGDDGSGQRVGVLADDPVASLVVLATAVDVGLGAEATTGVTGQDLVVGEVVTTGPTGFGEIDYVDGSLTRVDANTTFAVTTLSDEAGALDVEVRLDVGRTWNNVSEERTAQEGYRVNTPVGVAAVRGTVFDVDCRDPVGTGCQFTVIDGIVEVTTTTAEVVRLAQNQRVVVGPDGSAGAVQDVVLFDPTQTDPWYARNAAEDAQRAAGAGPLAGTGGRPAPATAEEDGTAPPLDQLSGTGPAASTLTFGPGVTEQRVVIGGPSHVGLRFSYCDAFVCGTSENVECIGNKYNPSFGGADLRTVEIGPLPGHTLESATIRVGRSPTTIHSVTTVTAAGASGATGPYSTIPAFTADGGLSFALDQSADIPQLPFDERFGRVCGVSEEERDAILAQFGTVAELTNAVAVVELVWRQVATDARAMLVGAEQSLVANNQPVVAVIPEAVLPPSRSLPIEDPAEHTVASGAWAALLVALTAPVPSAEVPTDHATEESTAQPPTPPQTPTGSPSPTSPPHSQDPLDWLGGVVGERAATFAEVGDVPTTLANAMGRLGLAVDPALVGNNLLAKGAWQPGGGVHLRDQGLGPASHVDLSWLAGEALAPEDDLGALTGRLTSVLAAIEGLQNGVPAAWVAAIGRAPAPSTAYVLLGYDHTSDRVVVLDPRRGPVDVTLVDLLRATTGVLELQRAAVPSEVAVPL